MFEASDSPRVYGVPPGVDFCRAFVEGFWQRTAGWDPMRMARVTVYVNTRRTGRRMTEMMAEAGARLLPRIVPVAELAVTAAAGGLPPPVPALRLKLQLMQVIHALLDQQPELAPRAAAFDLAESLSGLMDEMFDEGARPEAVLRQDVGALTAQWQRSVEVLSVILRWFGPEAEMSAAARLAALVGRREAEWAASPPTGPVIVAGSTGSRGTTHRLMAAVARMPQGAVVLPGFDFDLPGPVWEVLARERAEDHPQFRFAKFCQTLEVPPRRVASWHGPAEGGARNRLMSLALRPAPVSDQWVVEGPRLAGIGEAADGMTLIEAPGPRAEALAVALALRKAVEDGKTAAVVTPDRALTRMIAAELDRWGIVPDDSAGEPLAQSAPGRLLRLTAEALAEPVLSDQLLVILKHPLTHTGADRGRHLRWTRDLELRLRREGHPSPDGALLLKLATKDGEDRAGWAGWIAGALKAEPGEMALADHVRLHIAMAELLVSGPEGEPDELWAGAAGEAARGVMASLEREAEAGGHMTAVAYCDLVSALLARGEVRSSVVAHPQVRFWGTIEARVQGADLVVLAGLNDGVWPAHALPDPWMNRRMRAAAGLTSPERRVGLSAHDFTQAVTGGEVILSRAVMDGSAETVPSRWVSRLTNLLDGLEEGRPALDGMKARGRDWLAMAGAMDRDEKVDPVKRPAPRPPVAARPKQLSVTEIQTLIRDPYAIYARHVLRLRKLDPVRPEPDARLRGSLTHEVLETFLKRSLETGEISRAALLAAAEEVLEKAAAWPAVRMIWRARIEEFAEGFVAAEEVRRAGGAPLVIETKAVWPLGGPVFELTGKPDRIDRLADGTLEIIDYKTGGVPKASDLEKFDRQLWLLAVMAEGLAFEGTAGAPVTRLTHVGLGRKMEQKTTEVSPGQVGEALAQLRALIAAWGEPDRGYQARRAQEGSRFDGDYDHLARFGEWGAEDWPAPEDMA